MPRFTPTRSLVAGAAGVLLVGALAIAQMPSGHPDVSSPKKAEPLDETPLPPVAPRPQDVQTPEAVIAAYYASISGAKGEPRDWDRFRSLFLPDADLMSVQQMHQNVQIISLKPGEYMHLNDTYFTKGGYFESEINCELRSYGVVAQAFSTYESRRSQDQPAYARGINAFQLLYDGSRWWISSVTWQRENPNEPLPAEFLPAQ